LRAVFWKIPAELVTRKNLRRKILLLFRYARKKTMAPEDDSIIPSGQSKTFYYVGNLIPNQVLIQNLSPSSNANYTVKSGPHPWTYFSNIPAGGTQSILVQWPTSVAVFANASGGGVSIRVYGDGIRPATAEEAKAQ
jgi:hypothetical protein